jgi:hypothetical protein
MRHDPEIHNVGIVLDVVGQQHKSVSQRGGGDPAILGADGATQTLSRSLGLWKNKRDSSEFTSAR